MSGKMLYRDDLCTWKRQSINVELYKLMSTKKLIMYNFKYFLLKYRFVFSSLCDILRS